MSGLVLRQATVRYGDVLAVDRLDLDVAAGEVVALIGPSGCGKSSVLRAVAGLEPLAGGSVAFGGRDLAGVPVHRRDLGLMFQDSALFPHLDVAGNVAFGLRMHRWSRSRTAARVAELLAMVGLDGYGARPVRALSGGEAQRVALARALAPQPGLLMLDEPLGALDRPLREQLTRDVRHLLTSLGQTALHVTHDQAEAFALADRVAVMRAGRLVQVGAPLDLWREPADAFVARFLGHPNVWTAGVDAAGTVTWLGTAGTIGAGPSVPLGRGVGGARGMVAPGPVELLVPVSALALDPAGPIRGQVEVVELRDGVRRATVATRAGRLVVAIEDVAVASGDGVQVAVDLARCRVLAPSRARSDAPDV